MPNADTTSMRNQARRVKTLALNKIEEILTDPSSVDKSFYQDLLLKIAGNVVPRTQEITGEDGEAINVTFVNYADTKAPLPTSAVSSPPVDSV